MSQNISLLGATYSAVPAVLLPKQGGGTARFDDASVTTAVASDVASGKKFLAADGTITTGTASGGGGQSSYTLIGSAEVTLTNYTTTGGRSQATITVSPSAWQHAKIIYVRIRDKAGKRAGRFYGTDTYLICANEANGSTSDQTNGCSFCLRYTTSSKLEIQPTGGATRYGLFGYSIKTDGTVPIWARYNSTYTLTMDGTYKVEVYALAWPDGVNPFD